MTYLELCNKVYSHIQSKDVREYYLNEVKDSINPDMLISMIIYGYYNIEDKFVDISDFMMKYNSSNVYADILSEYNVVKRSYYYNDIDSIYIANFFTYSGNSVYVVDEPFYGKSFDDIKSKINSYMTVNNYIYDENFSRGYIDKVDMRTLSEPYIRYTFDIIDDSLVITNGYLYDRTNDTNGHHKYIPDLIYRLPQYPFKTGDKVKFKTPLMHDYIHGVYEFNLDMCGVPYIWMKYGDDPYQSIDLATMIDTIFDDFLVTDWITYD